MPNCGADYFPKEYTAFHERFSTVTRVCIGMDNVIDQPVEVVTSSGFPTIDDAATKCVTAGAFSAATVNGAPVRACKEIKVTFGPKG